MKLVYNSNEVILVFDAPDINLAAGQKTFEGTLTECKAKIADLGLVIKDDPYLVERIFKAPTVNTTKNRLVLIPDDDVLPLDVLRGIIVKTDGDVTYMRCKIPEESLTSLLENSSSGELDVKTVVELGLINTYVGTSEAEC